VNLNAIRLTNASDGEELYERLAVVTLKLNHFAELRVFHYVTIAIKILPQSAQDLVEIDRWWESFARGNGCY